MSHISEKLQTVGHSLGRDPFSKRNFWDEGPLSSSFTQVRCLSTPRAFATLGSPPIGRYSDTLLFGKRTRESTSTNGLLSALNAKKKRNSSLEDDEKCQAGEELLNATSDAPPQTCAVCGKSFKQDDVVVMFESQGFHTGCFCCGQCGGPVDPGKPFLVLEEGSPLCRQCSPLCNACGEKICTNHVAVLNRDFHEECLKCAQCNKQFATLSKVYACSGEPCCAKCITPVFDETWTPHSSPVRVLSERRRESLLGSPSTSKRGSVLTSSSPVHLSSLPPKLETQLAVDDPSSAEKFHSLLRPSFSAPVLSNRLNQPSHKLSLSSLESIMCDELGLPLFMNFCVEDCSIELVVFWLDVEHFRNFNGDTDDMKLFAHHIMLKYIGYYAELPLGLPKKMEDQIIADMQKTPVSKEIFTEAQQYVFTQMETTLLSRFLQSQDGQNYLKALVTRDIDRRQKNGEEGPLEGAGVIKATVTSFDRRQANTKYYVYEVTVEIEGTTFMVYRRYSEFHTLHQQLKATFSQEQFPVMPKKVLFGRSQTRLVAQKRLKDLQTYLQGVLSMSPAVTQSHVLRQFLSQTPSDREDEMFNNRMKQSQAAMY